MPTRCATRFGARMNEPAPLQDPALPALASGRHDALAAALARLGLRGARTVAVLKHHPGSRCTLAIAAGTDRYVVKLFADAAKVLDRKSTRLNSSHGYISYAVFCLKKKK